MRRHLRTLFAFLPFAFCLLPSARAADAFELKDGDRVLFIGDTFFEREGDHGHIETRLTAAFPDRNVTFRNLAWAGDSPTGKARASFDWNKDDKFWLAHVKEQLALVKPTVAFLSYGMTAALELAETKAAEQPAKLEKFKTDLGKLMDAIEEVSGQKVRFVLVGPILREQPYADRAATYALGAASTNQVPTLQELKDAVARRSVDKLSVLASGWAKESRERFLRSLKIATQQTFEASTEEVDASNKQIRQVQRHLQFFADARQAAFVSLADLTRDSKEGQTRPWTDNGIQLNEDGHREAANRVMMELLHGSGYPIETSSISPADYERRLNERLTVLNAAIRKKNELFFHRWRPENWTYLFGFRKGEQGRNGVEIPRFDPLIAEWDARIAKLRDLKHQDPAMVKEVQGLLAAEEAAHRAVPKPRAPQPVPTFTVADGFEVNLWAENPSLHKPIHMNWDAQGRLWVASSEVYPQIQPGQPATDSVVVLEDTDGDGTADKHTVFADGLLIPTGVLPDDRGGVYVAASSQLLHFADTDGDGRADKKTIVLSSFGTEDTHHNLHTLRWGYDGHMYLNQSIYTHTHIETPWGVRRLNSAGIWRFNPDSWRLEVFTKGGCNPWGHHWDQYGNSFFTDGAGGKGIYHAMEGATYFTYSDMRREADSISPGSYPKFASLELVHSPAFPADWQGSAITCDFRAHRVVRFGMEDAASTFLTKEMPDLLRSTNVTFRPIDLRFGPDGALYIADWSNPIIQHGEVDFRDPRRDKEHGRIWRVTGKGRPLAKKQDLTRLDTAALLDRTLSANGWEQEQSRVVLRQRGADKVLPVVRPWLAKQTDPRAKLEAMWIHEAFERPDDALVGELVVAQDARIRTAAARQLSR